MSSFTHVLTYRTHPFRIHLPSLTFVRPRDQLIHRVRFRTGSLTLVTLLAGVSYVAQYGPPVHDRADPARSRMQLQPLPGICISTVAVAVSTHASHTGVSRRPDCTRYSLSYPHRETQPHDRAWQPSSPVCTATSQTRSLSPYTVAHSHTVPHSYRLHHSHPRGHSPTVSHPHRGVHTHVPLPARTWFPPTAVPLSHTARREAHTPAHP